MRGSPLFAVVLHTGQFVVSWLCRVLKAYNPPAGVAPGGGAWLGGQLFSAMCVSTFCCPYLPILFPAHHVCLVHSKCGRRKSMSVCRAQGWQVLIGILAHLQSCHEQVPSR